METGKKVFDKFDIPMRTSSIYIGLDSPKWDIAGQVRKLGKGLNITEGDYGMMDSRILFRGSKPRPNIMDPAFFDWLGELRQEHGIDTVFIDTFRRLHDRNENDSGEMGAVMERLEDLVDKQKATIIMATHTSKPAQGVVQSALYETRGSTVIPGSADYHYGLRLSKQNYVLLNGTAKRRGGSRREGWLTLELKDLPDGGLGIQIVPEEASTEGDSGNSAILDALGTSPTPLTAPRLCELTGLTYSKVDHALRRLAKEGKITKVGRGLWKAG